MLEKKHMLDFSWIFMMKTGWFGFFSPWFLVFSSPRIKNGGTNRETQGHHGRSEARILALFFQGLKINGWEPKNHPFKWNPEHHLNQTSMTLGCSKCDFCLEVLASTSKKIREVWKDDPFFTGWFLQVLWCSFEFSGDDVSHPIYWLVSTSRYRHRGQFHSLQPKSRFYPQKSINQHCPKTQTQIRCDLISFSNSLKVPNP